MLNPLKDIKNLLQTVKKHAGNYGAQCRFWSASPPTELSPLIFTWMDGILG